MKINNIKLIFDSKGFYPVLALVIIDIILVVMLIYSGFYVYSLYSEFKQVEARLEENKQKALLVKNNKEQLENRVANFNSALDRLIPDQESYFQIISAFEKLSAITGLPISNYTINLEDTTTEKISFTLELSGTSDEIENFLLLYPFASGRLIVSEEFALDFEDGAKLNLNLNMYNAIYANSELPEEVPIVSTEKINDMQKIIDTMSGR